VKTTPIFERTGKNIDCNLMIKTRRIRFDDVGIGYSIDGMPSTLIGTAHHAGDKGKVQILLLKHRCWLNGISNAVEC
jgi:hypothetical protein